jgi:hypothetical protein
MAMLTSLQWLEVWGLRARLKPFHASALLGCRHQQGLCFSPTDTDVGILAARRRIMTRNMIFQHHEMIAIGVGGG